MLNLSGHGGRLRGAGEVGGEPGGRACGELCGQLGEPRVHSQAGPVLTSHTGKQGVIEGWGQLPNPGHRPWLRLWTRSCF